MNVTSFCGRDKVEIGVPDGAIVYESRFPEPEASAAELVLGAVRNPIGSPPLGEALERRREGDVVVVVSDITRPVPYARFLPALLAEIEAAGVRREDILVLVGTGMHRPCTADEHAEMLGEVAGTHRICDHDSTDGANLMELSGKTWSGVKVRLNRHFVEAGFRLITGLVEPHFMAGFSGGRKAVCPGVAGLETIQNFHGQAFMGNPLACNASLEGNPCHEEALSVARMAGVDFSLNVVMNKEREVVRAFAGGLEAAHGPACEFARRCVCPTVKREADVVVTSSGGYPLDATFYQCVKGLVSCLPAVRQGGTIVAFGGCSEGVGSLQYTQIMKDYAGRWREFLEDIQKPGFFIKDQWELQMHARALAKVGDENLHFISDGLPQGELEQLSVNAHAAGPGRVAEVVQRLLDRLLADGATVAVIPEGPYCAPLAAPS